MASMRFDGLMQLPVTVVGIQLEFVGFHGVGFLAFIPVSRGCGRPYRVIGVKLSHESHHNYTIFHLQFHHCFDSTNGVWRTTPQPKGWGLARKIDKYTDSHCPDCILTKPIRKGFRDFHPSPRVPMVKIIPHLVPNRFSRA